MPGMLERRPDPDHPLWFNRQVAGLPAAMIAELGTVAGGDD